VRNEDTATIRMASARDAAQVAAIYAPYVVGAATSFELEPPDAGEIGRRIETVLPFAPWLVCVDGGQEVIGYAYTSRHRDRAAYQWSVDVAVYIRADHHRRGVGRALYEALFPLLRLQGFYLAHAGITLPNPGSVGLHEALGFRPIGVYPAVGWKLGSWRDVGWWQLPLGTRPPVPAPPLSLASARTLPAWKDLLESPLFDEVQLKRIRRSGTP
jgi:L-amino acid N-acyltransferase YncA